MVFVFGIDIPLVELIFVLTIILVLLFALLIYVAIILNKLNRLLHEILLKEDTELKGLQDIEDKEMEEISLLRQILLRLRNPFKSVSISKKIEKVQTHKRTRKRRKKAKKRTVHRKAHRKARKKRKYHRHKKEDVVEVEVGPDKPAVPGNVALIKPTKKPKRKPKVKEVPLKPY